MKSGRNSIRQPRIDHAFGRRLDGKGVVMTAAALGTLFALVTVASPAASQGERYIAPCTHSQLGLLNVPAMTFSNSLQPGNSVLPIVMSPNSTYWVQVAPAPFGMAPFPSPAPSATASPGIAAADSNAAQNLVLYRIEPTTGAVGITGLTVKLPSGLTTTENAPDDGCRAVALVIDTTPGAAKPPAKIDYLLQLPTIQELSQSLNRFTDISVPWGMSQPRNAGASLPLSRTSGDLGTTLGPFALKMTFGQDGFDVIQKRLSIGAAPSAASSVSSGGGGGRHHRGGTQGSATPAPGSAGATPPPSPDTSGFNNVASSCYGCYDFRSEDTAIFQPLSSAQATIGGLQAQQFGLGRYIFEPSTVNYPYDSSGNIIYGTANGSLFAGVRVFSGTVPQATPAPGGTSAPQGAVAPYINSSIVAAAQYTGPANAVQVGVTTISARLGSGFDQTLIGATIQHAWNATSILKLGKLSTYLELGEVYGPPAPSKVFSDNDTSRQNRIAAISYGVPAMPAGTGANPCGGTSQDAIAISAGWRDVGGSYIPFDGTATYRYYGLKGPTAGVAVNVIPEVALTAQATRGLDGTGVRMSDSVLTMQGSCRWSRETDRSQRGITYVTLTPAISYENVGSDAAIWGRAQFNNVTQPAGAILRTLWLNQIQNHPTVTIDALFGDRGKIADPTHELKVTLGEYIGSSSVLCSSNNGPANCISYPIHSPSVAVAYSSNVYLLNVGFNNSDQPPGSNDAPRSQQQSYSALATLFPRACVTGGISVVKYINSAQNPNGTSWIGSLDIPFLNAQGNYHQAIVPDLLIEYSASPSQSTNALTALTGAQTAPYIYARLRLGGGMRYKPGRCGPIP